MQRILLRHANVVSYSGLHHGLAIHCGNLAVPPLHRGFFCWSIALQRTKSLLNPRQYDGAVNREFQVKSRRKAFFHFTPLPRIHGNVFTTPVSVFLTFSGHATVG